MRIAKFLAHAGLSSRRDSEEKILKGEIKVNGEIVKELALQVDPEVDIIEYRNQVIKIEPYVYIVFYKPAGCLSTVHDPFNRATVMSYFPAVTQRIYPVGRLDFDTSGLLILSNDGEFTNLMIHPRFKIEKTYQVKVQERPDEGQLERLRRGIPLEDGITAPAKVKILKSDQGTRLEIVIHEGRKRQIKRMFAAIGHSVIDLKRTGFGFLDLQGLRSGEYRFLTPQEINRLIKAARGS